MATTRFQSGGAFQPNEPLNLTGDASNFINAPTIGGTSTVPGTSTVVGSTDTQTLTNKTLTAPTITAPVISGAATVASGATLTTPTMTITTSILTATGSTGSDAASVTAVAPAYIGITGATGSGVNLPTGPIGLFYMLGNDFAGNMRIYSVGGTINGTTGTTAFTITSTGNKLAFAVNTSASGAWFIKGNT